MSGLSFIKEYITKPRTVGAIWPSSKYLAKKMVADIDFGTAKYIVEYGPGTGVFTDRILQARNPDTVVLLIENNQEFHSLLTRKYQHHPNLNIEYGSAANLETYLEKNNIPQADYIISGLPFASLPPEVSAQILAQTKKHLAPEGRFVTFQYTLLKKDFIGEYFPDIEIKRELRNIPPAHVLSCKAND
ncbi:MAG: SAM-dependent methyltransferase [Defluviitaleaceae bacterium]|nr:SAM-dependent methyltransferase [Defluviitaleaceae bacterium]